MTESRIFNCVLLIYEKGSLIRSYSYLKEKKRRKRFTLSQFYTLQVSVFLKCFFGVVIVFKKLFLSFKHTIFLQNFYLHGQFLYLDIVLKMVIFIYGESFADFLVNFYIYSMAKYFFYYLKIT